MPAEVLISTSIASLSGWHPISITSVVDWNFRRFVLGLVCNLLLLRKFVKVLSCIIGLRLARPIEVVKHQIHIFLLFDLQVVSDLNVSVDLYFNVRVGLATQGSRLVELGRTILLRNLHTTSLSLPGDGVAMGLGGYSTSFVAVFEQRLFLTVGHVKRVAPSVLRVVVGIDVVFAVKVFIGVDLLTVVDSRRRIHPVLNCLLPAAGLAGALVDDGLLAHLVLVAMVVKVVVREGEASQIVFAEALHGGLVGKRRTGVTVVHGRLVLLLSDAVGGAGVVVCFSWGRNLVQDSEAVDVLAGLAGLLVLGQVFAALNRTLFFGLPEARLLLVKVN